MLNASFSKDDSLLVNYSVMRDEITEETATFWAFEKFSSKMSLAARVENKLLILMSAKVQSSINLKHAYSIAVKLWEHLVFFDKE